MNINNKIRPLAGIMTKCLAVNSLRITNKIAEIPNTSIIGVILVSFNVVGMKHIIANKIKNFSVIIFLR